VKKIFQVPYPLAPVAADHLDEFLAVAYTDAGLPSGQLDDLRIRVEPHLGYVVGDDGANPREIKRYINAYVLQRKMSERLDADVVLTLQTIAFRPDWKPVQKALLTHGRFFLEALGQRVGVVKVEQPIALEELDPDLALPDSFLEYVALGRPGRAILTYADGKLLDSDDIDMYLYRGEAVRTAQDSFLLKAIRGSGAASRSLRSAARLETNIETRAKLLDDAKRGQAHIWSYLEWGMGSLLMRDTVERDLHRYDEAATRLKDPERPEELRREDLDEMNRLAQSIQERLMRIYRAREAPSATGHER
jgi:hypothetical protein